MACQSEMVVIAFAFESCCLHYVTICNQKPISSIMRDLASDWSLALVDFIRSTHQFSHILQEMAEISSKAALAAVTPKAADKNSSMETGSGFSSLPSSIHHGLSEKLHGFTEKLHALAPGAKNAASDNTSASTTGNDGATSGCGGPASSRSRTSSWGTGAHPSLAVGAGGNNNSSASPQPPAVGAASAASATSPSRTCSRTSSKKSNQSTLISNGKMTDGA